MNRFVRLSATTAAALLLLSGCKSSVTTPTTTTTTTSEDNAKDAEAVKGIVAKLVAAFNAHDAKALVAFDAPDYVGMIHGMPNVVGIEADLALSKLQVADAASKLDMSDEDVNVAEAGDQARWQATYAYTFTDPATRKPTTEHGNWLLGFTKQGDGSWKLKWSVVSDTGPAPAAAAPA